MGKNPSNLASQVTDEAMHAFEAHRGLLFGVAYRMLGSAADAEDILQEARVRWLGVAGQTVESPRAFLVTVVSRLALDHLKSARVRREEYVGPWLPEPVVLPSDVDASDISTAFLLLLERLSPPERAAFLLHDVFDYEHAEVARILGKSEEACRQLASRAKKHLHDARPRPSADAAEHARLLAAFSAATLAGDLKGLERLLAADAVMMSDGGGKANAARKAIHGATDVARFVLGIRRFYTDMVASACTLNGLPGLRFARDGVVHGVFSIDVVEGQISAVYGVLNPDKLTHVG
jgi:RNA polymerase sigma-70 factor (ECF subfamily)